MVPQNTRREQERALRHDLLLCAAERVFRRRPFDEATMQEIAAEAQIGMQGLYEHFPSKQVLYEELILHRSRAYQARVAQAFESLTDPLEQLRALARVQVTLFRERPGSFPLFAKERLHWEWQFDSRFSERFSEIYEAERRRLRGVLEEAVRGEKLRQVDPDFLVQFYIGTVHASMLYMHRSGPDEEVEPCVERAMDCFLRGAGVRT